MVGDYCQVEEVAHAGGADGEEFLADAEVECFVLLQEDVESRAALSGEHDDEADVFVARGDDGCYGAAFAVAADAEV